MDRAEDHGLPPEGLWVSPDGDPVTVIEHLIALKENPEIFGLTEREVEKAKVKDLRDIAVKLIGSGWMRFRFLGGVWAFEVNSVKAKTGLIEEILVGQNAYPEERVIVSQVSPKRDYQGSVSQFYDRSMFRHYELGRGNRWRVS